MNWLSPSLLYFAIFGAVPILLHFLLRERMKKVAFSAMRFLRKQSREVLSHKKFWEWLLTILRVACILLLVTAFARPFLASPIDGVTKFGSETFVLLDASRSMRFENRFAEAQSQAESIVKSAPADSRITVVTFGGADQIHFSEPGDANAALAAITHAAPSAGSTDILAAMDKVLETIRQHNSSGEVHLVSDLQASALPRNREVRKLPPSFKFFVHSVGGAMPKAGGIAVEGGAFSADVTPGEQNFNLAVRIHNRGPAREVSVQLILSGKTIASKQVQLPQDSETSVSLSGTLREIGEHAGKVVVTGASTILPGDDTFNFIVRVVRKVRVAILNGHPSKNEKDDAVFFLLAALNAGADTPYTAQGFQTLPDLKEFDVVITSGVSALPDGDIKRLNAFVKGGGGLLIAADQAIEPAAFNAGLGTISLSRLRTWNFADELFLVPANTHNAFVSQVASEGSGNLTTGHFNGFWDLKDTQDSDVILRFSNNRPALLECRQEKGTVLFFSAGMDIRAGDFPLHGIFVPFVREAVRMLQAHDATSRGVVAGGTMQMDADATIDAPDGTTQKSPAGSMVAFTQPGIYTVKSGTQTSLYAVNGDPKESDLTLAPAVDLEKLLASPPETEIRRTAQGFERILTGDARTNAEHRQNLGWWCLMGVAALCLSELCVAQIASRK